jgi:hypothetical protein
MHGLLFMRLIIGISLLLLGVGALSCRLESAIDPTEPPRPAIRWVRTVNGWERPEAWLAAPVRVPQLHPLVVAVGQALVSVWALTAFRCDDELTPS